MGTYIADKCSRRHHPSNPISNTISWSLYGLTMKLDICFANEPCIHIAYTLAQDIIVRRKFFMFGQWMCMCTIKIITFDFGAYVNSVWHVLLFNEAVFKRWFPIVTVNVLVRMGVFLHFHYFIIMFISNVQNANSTSI